MAIIIGVTACKSTLYESCHRLVQTACQSHDTCLQNAQGKARTTHEQRQGYVGISGVEAYPTQPAQVSGWLPPEYTGPVHRTVVKPAALLTASGSTCCSAMPWELASGVTI
jgi:hypothetical protein